MMFLWWGIAFIFFMVLAITFSYHIFSGVRAILNPIVGIIEGLLLIIFHPFIDSFKTGGIIKLFETIIIAVVILAFVIFIIRAFV